MGTNRNAPRTTALLVSAKALLAFAAFICALPLSKPALAQQQQARPNILVVFGDDIGQSNISAYSHGLVGYKTPNKPHCQGRHDVHGLLCRELVHGGPLNFHHWSGVLAYRPL